MSSRKPPIIKSQSLKETANEIKFSVLTTIYNKAEFLNEAVESVLNQTFEEFELILVDDQSTDDSFKLAEKLASRDSRIRVFRNEQNLGDYPNRNVAVRLAKYEYLKFLDADDTFFPRTLEIYRSAIQQTASSSPAYFFANINPKLDERKVTVLTPKEAYRRQYIHRLRTFEAAPTSCLYKKSLLLNSGGFIEKPFIGDFDMAHRLSAHGEVGMIETPDPLSFWRLHNNQQSQKNRTTFSIGNQYNQVSLSHLAKVQDFFTKQELRNIKERLCHAEAQALRSAIKNFQLNQIPSVLSSRNFPISHILRKTLRSFPLAD